MRGPGEGRRSRGAGAPVRHEGSGRDHRPSRRHAQPERTVVLRARRGGITAVDRVPDLGAGRHRAQSNVDAAGQREPVAFEAVDVRNTIRYVKPVECPKCVRQPRHEAVPVACLLRGPGQLGQGQGARPEHVLDRLGCLQVLGPQVGLRAEYVSGLVGGE